MTEPEKPRKVDWVAVGTLTWSVVAPVISTIIAGGFYLISRLNQIDSKFNEFDVRFTRIETRMGIDEQPKRIANR
ncbi:MAG: hypothetical protein V4719_20460 [Planctomycetota bacterium]